ncbi:MAG: glycoside hydrolase family 127 protein, partial [Proteiniphilum sp.]|nr:glycoside hydrolase family 127 protein [Proteiniphilum sp.]
IYGISKSAVWVNLYIGNIVRFHAGKEKFILRQETNYPWDGKVKLIVDSLNKPLQKEIRLRIPAWCENYFITVNGNAIENVPIEKGYAVIDRKWTTGNEISLTMEMPVETVQSDPRVKENIGKRAVQRGPLVYCVEEADNPFFDQLTLSPDTRLDAMFTPGLLNGVVTITAVAGEEKMVFIPYYAWDNRDAGQMKVWIDYVE